MDDAQDFADLVELAIKSALMPVLQRLSAAEARVQALTAVESSIGEMRERVAIVETKAAAPLPAPTVVPDVAGLVERVTSELTKDMGALRERVAVVEVRAQVPGPAGKDGRDGTDGAPGVPGADGLGFEDLDVEFDGDRTLTIKAERGSLKKAWPIVLPYQKQQGVYEEGRAYVKGDLVTWGGSQWHANEPTTTKPGEGSKAWTLVVKRGRDGKDGKDAVTLPVVKVGA